MIRSNTKSIFLNHNTYVKTSGHNLAEAYVHIVIMESIIKYKEFIRSE